MTPLIIFPFLIPLITGFSALLKRRGRRRVAFSIGVTANLIAAVVIMASTYDGTILISQMGDHPMPFGISLVIDSLSAIMLLLTAVIAFLVGIFAMATIDANRERFAFFPLFAFLVAGLNFAFLTGDLFSLYVAFEIMLMSSFVMLTLGGERGQLEGGIKYVTINLISSTIFVVAAGLTYAVAGTLNMAHLAIRFSQLADPGVTLVLAGMFLIAFGIKAAIFPLFFWLPASYHTPPIAVTALFGGLLTKVGIYAMWRVLILILPAATAILQPLLITVSIFTMIVGVLGAVAQMDVRRLLSFHVISQIGYLLMSLAIGTTDALSAGIFFMAHVILAKTALFLISGIVHELEGSYHLKHLGSVAKRHPGAAVMFFIAALALAGIPPFSGFWAKFLLLRAGIEAQQYLLVGVGLAVSLLTLYSMIKIWNEVFWKPNTYTPSADEQPTPLTRIERRAMIGAAAVMVVLVFALGIAPESMISLSNRAAAELFPNGLGHSGYVDAVVAASAEIGGLSE